MVLEIYTKATERRYVTFYTLLTERLSDRRLDLEPVKNNLSAVLYAFKEEEE